jgi:hypothetical protein
VAEFEVVALPAAVATPTPVPPTSTSVPATATPRPTSTSAATPTPQPATATATPSVFTLISNPTPVILTFADTGNNGQCQGLQLNGSEQKMLSTRNGILTMASANDPRVATGPIQPDGSFTISSITDTFVGKIDPTGTGSAVDTFVQGGCVDNSSVTFTPAASG